MRVSLITTTHNRPEFLLICAESVGKQSYPCYEWIIYIDDDYFKYVEVINKIKVLVPQVKVIGGEKVGRVKALSLAHEIVKGDYIALLDDDDWLATDCLEHCRLWDSDIVYTDFYCVREKSVLIGTRNTENYSWSKMLQYNIMFHFRLYKTSLYYLAGGFDLSFDTTMDYEITLRMLLHKPSITKINLPLYYYKIHEDSISGRQRERQVENKKRAVSKVLTLCNEKI